MLRLLSVILVLAIFESLSTAILIDDVDLRTIGAVHLNTGRYKEAIASYRKALLASPEKLWIYSKIVEVMKTSGSTSKTEWKNLLTEMEESVRKYSKSKVKIDVSKVPPALVPGSSETFLALGQVAEEAGAFDSAWKYYMTANDYDGRKRKSYDFQRTQQLDAGIMDHFNNDFFQNDNSVGVDSNFPIFLIGMPYSGSTVLQQLLDAHSSIFDLNANPTYFQMIQDKMGVGLRYSLFEGRLGPIQKALNERNEEELNTLAKGIVSDMDMVARFITRSGTGTGGRQILHSVDSYLENYRMLGAIHYLFPKAVFVNVMRDPMDILVDMVIDRDHANQNQARTYAPVDVVKYYVSYLRMTAHWRTVIPKDQFIDMFVDDLVADPEKALQPLLDALGVEFEDSQRDVELDGLIPPAGHWRRFAEGTAELSGPLVSELTKLRGDDVTLPFDDVINWSINPQFAYKRKAPTEVKSTQKQSSTPKDASTVKTAVKKTAPATASTKTQTQTTTIEKTSKGMPEKDHEEDEDEDEDEEDAVAAATGLHQKWTVASERSSLRSLSAQLPAHTGDNLVDEVITQGYVKLQTKDATTAESIFREVLKVRGDAVAAVQGLGSVLVQSQRVAEALDVYSDFLRSFPDNPTGYVIRAEAYTSLGLMDAALADLDRALDLDPSHVEALTARGRQYIKMKYFVRAETDLKKAVRLQPSPIVHYYLAQCAIQFQHIQKAVDNYDAAIALDPNIKEIYLQKAHAQMEGARWRDALDTLVVNAKVDPKNRYVYSFRGLLLHDIGSPLSALSAFQQALDIEPKDVSVMALMAVCHQAVGSFQRAVRMHNRILDLVPEHKAFWAREVVSFWYIHKDDDFSTFNIDKDIGETVVTAKLDEKVIPADTRKNLALFADKIPRHDKPQEPLQVSPAALRLLSLTSHLGKWVQLNCEGFSPSVRQHRQFGLAVLEMAQTIRRHVSLRRMGGRGLQVKDAASSRGGGEWSVGSKEGCRPGHHWLGYRDVMDIAVRWRQLSDPNADVFWFDRLPPDEKGFSLMTHMVQGEMELLRYYTYYPWGFNIMKTKMATELYIGNATNPTDLDDSQLETLAQAKDLKDLYDIVGDAIWVIAPVKGIVHPGKVLDGTRVVLTAHPPEGFAFTIRTPISIGNRTAEFEAELEGAFDRLLSVLEALPEDEDGDGATLAEVHRTALCRHALELFYYWANFAPLTRGTAATGYALLQAALLAGGKVIGRRMPSQRQLDWEAIFTPEPGDFVEHGQSWLEGLMPTPFPTAALDGVDGYSVSEVINTPAKAIAAISKFTGLSSEVEEKPFLHNGEVLDEEYAAYLRDNGDRDVVLVKGGGRSNQDLEDAAEEEDDDEDEEDEEGEEEEEEDDEEYDDDDDEDEHDEF